MENRALFDQWELEESLEGLQTYERALHRAPYRKDPLLREDRAKEEIQRVQRLARMCESQIGDGDDRFRSRMLHPVGPAEIQLLKAARLLRATVQCRTLEHELETLRSRKGEACTLEEQRDLDTRLEQVAASLEERRADKRDVPEGVLQDLLLSADQILDLASATH